VVGPTSSSSPFREEQRSKMDRVWILE